MISFRSFTQLEEDKYSAWAKETSLFWANKVRNLTIKIQNTKNTRVQNKMIAQQNRLIARLQALGIEVALRDKEPSES